MNISAAGTGEVHMETGSISKTLLLFALPVLLSQLLQQVYNITDCIIVGRFCGNFGLAAAGLGGLVLSVITNFFIGFSTGVTVIVSQHFGSGKYYCIKTIITTMVHLGLILGFALSGLLMFFTKPILVLLNCPEQVLPACRTYLLICCMGMAPILAFNLGDGILRALGDTRSSLRYLLYSGALNLFLDLLLCIVFPFGLAGASAATAISQWFLFVLVILRLRRLNPAYAYRTGNPLMSFAELKHLVYISLPSGMQAVFMSASSLLLQISINSFGAAAISGMTVFAKLEGFLYYPTFAYGIALTGFVGQNYGAKCMDRVKEAVRISLKLSTAIILPLSLALIMIAKPVLGIFTTDEFIISNGFQAISSIFPLYFLYAINQVYLGALKGLGETNLPMVCTMVCYCIFRVLWCRFLIPVFHSMLVVYTSYDISWIIMILMLIPMFCLTFKKRENTEVICFQQ